MEYEPVDNLVQACHLLSAKGFGPSTSGNLSMRSADKIHLTATGLALQEVKVDNLACCDIRGNPLAGPKPTKELGFHLAIYCRRPDVNAIIHLHPTFAVAVSTLLPAGPQQYVPSVTPQFVMKVGKVPVIPYYPPGTVQVAQAVGDVCDGSAILLQNHGAIAFADTLKKAIGVVEELEENCKLWFLVRKEGRLLTTEEIDQLLEMYGDKY